MSFQAPTFAQNLSSGPLLAPLAAWFDGHRRAMPWRAADLDALHPDPYAVLVSELMLQQTQVATVIPYFQRWMARFPDARTLAAATEDEVHRHWEGLGYYRRARHLQAAATTIAKEGWPSDLAGLQCLPGLGPYTAAALASIAFQWPEPALDGNAFRVLARLLGLREDPKTQATALREWLRPALAEHGPSRLTQALMELGALVCAPAPRCQACPLREACQAHRLDRTDQIPPKTVRPLPKSVALHLVALEAEGAWLLHPPEAQGLLAGLWRWPTLEALVTEEGLFAKDQAAEALDAFATVTGETWPAWTQVYTHRKELITPVCLRLAARPAQALSRCWVSPPDLAALPMGKRDQKLRSLLLQPGVLMSTGSAVELLRALLEQGQA